MNKPNKKNNEESTKKDRKKEDKDLIYITIPLKLENVSKENHALLQKHIEKVAENKNDIASRCVEKSRIGAKIDFSSKNFKIKLPSAIINQNINDVKSDFKNLLEAGSRKSKPFYKPNQPLIFNNQSYGITDGNVFSIPLFNGERCKRHKFTVVKCSNLKKLYENIDNGAELGALSLRYKNNEYYFVVSVGFKPEKAQGANYMGVDVGIKQLAVSSVMTPDGCEIAYRFSEGESLSHFKEKYSIKKAKAVKKQNVKRLEKIKEKERNVTSNTIHTQTKKVVEFAVKNDVSTIIMEDLKNIRKGVSWKNLSRKIGDNAYKWCYGQIQDKIEHKAQKQGIEVLYVQPQYTSQICHRCGHVEERNRRKTDFKCRRCGHEAHADLNAARNIAEKWLSENVTNNNNNKAI